MTDTLEYNEIYQEVKGCMIDGRLRLNRQMLSYKSNKTGKVDTIQATDLTEGYWRRVALGYGMKLHTKNGHIYKYDGFRESDYDKLSDFFKSNYRVDLTEKDFCVKGWNWGTVRFGGKHGKTFDYKIPYTTVLRLFVLPHKDQRQMFFVISLDPPIKQGQTRYHFLILLFSKDDDIALSLNMSEEELEKKFQGKLTKNMSGCLYEMVSRIMKALVNRKITVPGNFQGHSGAHCITCSYKASSGLLYPLERGFIYVHKPPVHIRFDEISCVNFARGTTTTRSFDFEIETKQGTQYTFSSIERHGSQLFFNPFLPSVQQGIKQSYDDYADSDEDPHDAYLERMKEEGKIREEAANDSSEDSGEETDESFNPGQEEEDVAEEFDSNASASASSDEEGSEEEEKKRPAKKPKLVKERKPHKKAEGKKAKDPQAPKRPMSAYMLWLNANREKIKSDNPGISITDLSKKAGELWKGMTKDKKEEWDRKAEIAKKDYEKAMKEYKESGGADAFKKESAKKSKGKAEKKPAPKAPPVKVGNESFKSKEFVSSEDSSSEERDSGKSKKRKEKKVKKEKESEEEEEEEILSTPASGSDSDSD
nr:PREDICTED: FACT complex subunit SSRP1 [Latimeria chalumnae]|eukprot:XP_014353403.1 PREDICTED: FACT complex subunit SSRP1 [Latimeria chalumnae]